MTREMISSSLIGQNVTIYRGGPESKSGVILDVQKDYLALYTQQEIVYYQSEHIQSITVNTKENLSVQDLKNEVNYKKASDFLSLLSTLINQEVKIYQGGPESRQGILLSLGDDYAAILTREDGVIYYNLFHVKSIELKESKDDNISKQNEHCYPAKTFKSLFKFFNHKWVSINRNGPEAVEGILVENSNGLLTIIHHEELYKIDPFHVKSISVGERGAGKGNQKQENNNESSSSSANFEESSSSSSRYKESSSSSSSFSIYDDEYLSRSRGTRVSSSTDSYHSYRQSVQSETVISRSYIWKPR
ncbi:hypothetical protein [Heyndrickxia ginsengihumi]|uniref:hypothetical protein n=1 Tax=Heyndrickxia ginsengihumi TaxID=363870 RepID=UPI0004AFF9BA|nr:hypothetical protein [Heyndrickxia ginsengihumi]